ncbi:hypothetical protein GC197_09345 [bacterium]|nr:hypothetical protein [bacterium]
MPTNTTIKDFDLSGQTVVYGKVQIGGSGGPVSPDIKVKSTPPSFSLKATNNYDETGRTVVSHRIQMTVKSVFFSDDQFLSAKHLEFIRQQLLEPRQTLQLIGTGTGFDNGIVDVSWGPKPVDCDIQMFGKQTATVTWIVEFDVAPCYLSSRSQLKGRFKSFVFAQSYQNDDEGFLTRVTSGYWEVSPQASGTFQIADSFRDQFLVEVPTGFQRLGSSYNESPDKTRMDFEIVDTQLRGDALPPFITKGDGSFSVNTAGPGFANMIAVLNAQLTVAPGVPPNYAYLQFVLMAQQKIEQLSSNGDSAVVPMVLRIPPAPPGREELPHFFEVGIGFRLRYLVNLVDDFLNG